jgi:Monomeric isocitrate dehydrogenase
VLKAKTAVKAAEIVDCATMSRKALKAFIAEQIADAKASGVLLSVHLKATMMKVSDPIMFGVIVEEFYNDVLAKHAAALAEVGFNANNGIGDLYARIKDLPADKQAEIEATSRPCTPSVQPWPWSTPTRASPTCTCRATSSSTPRCQR